MSHFSREAVKLLRAAEDALSGRRPTNSFPQAASHKESLGKGNDELNEMQGSMPVLELQRQLRIAMTEINNLRSELAAERETRSQTITLLGRRWKEEMIVEIRASDHQFRRAISELEVNMQQQRKEEATARALMQRQLDDVTRGNKVRERSNFDQQEYIQEQLNSFRERLESAVAECGLVRVESAQQLEKERASLAHRLDTELLRYVDMHRKDQRERETLKQELKADVAAFGTHVKDLVDEAWRTHAVALERTLREPIDIFSRQIAQHEATVAGMETKIHDCATSCRAEVRLHTASLQERVSELESTSAVTVSRVDRAERKADAAQEAASRADASVCVTRDTAERAVAQAQRAMERAQRMEDTVQDRDARLAQLETQLGAVATAEKLRAEIEGVRRAALRAESGVDALRQVCERDEQLAEHTRRVVDGYTDRIEGCEQLVHRLRAALESVEGRVPQVQQRVAALEEAREGLAAATTRIDDTVTQVNQRIQTTEGALRGIAERLDQAQRDTLSGLHALTTRLEYASDMALRGETSNTAARTEVDRVSRRVCELEALAARMASDCAASRNATEDYAKDATALSTRLQQTREWQEHREARMDSAIAELEKQTTTALEQMSGRLESRLQRDLHRLQTTFEERVSAIEMSVEREVKLLQEHAVKPQMARGDDDATHRLAREMQTCKAKIESLNTALISMNDNIEQGQKEHVLLRDWSVLRKTVLTLESQLRAIHEDAATQHQTCEDCQTKVRHVESEQRRQRLNMQELRELLNEVREEVQKVRSSPAASATPAIKDCTPTSTVSAAAATTITREVKKLVGQGAEHVSLVEFRELRSSDPEGNKAMTSRCGTTTTSTPPTHPQTSSTDVILRSNHNDSPDAQPLQRSLEIVDDLEIHSLTATPLATASRRFTSSRNNMADRQPVTVISNFRGAKSPETKNKVPGERVTVLSSAFTQEHDGEGNIRDGADEASKVAEPRALMRPPDESSNSAGSSEKATRQSHVFPLGQHFGGNDALSEVSSSAVVPFTLGEQSKKSTSLTPAKNTETAKDSAPSVARNVTWYDDWDDSFASDAAVSARRDQEDESSTVVVPFTSLKLSPHGDKTCAPSSKVHVSFSNGSSELEAEEVVPRHGVTTTGTFSPSELKAKSFTESVPKHTTSFDDTTSEEEDV